MTQPKDTGLDANFTSAMKNDPVCVHVCLCVFLSGMATHEGCVQACVQCNQIYQDSVSMCCVTVLSAVGDLCESTITLLYLPLYSAR